MQFKNELLDCLKQESFDAVFQEANETCPVDQILIYLNETFTLHIRVTEQILKEKDYYKIDFFAPFACKANPKTLYDVSSLLHYLNFQSELPAFHLNEGEMQPFFRLVQIFKAIPDPLLLKSLIGHIFMNLEVYSPLIETVATGQKTFNGIIEEVLELIQ